MKTYTQLVLEVELITRPKSNKFGLQSYLNKDVDKVLEKGKFKVHHTDSMSGGHKLIHATARDPNHKHYFLAGSDNKIKTALTTRKRGKSELVGLLASHDSATIKAHDLYHHLITKHNKILTSDMQTTGGLKVWQKLAKKHSVNIHAVDAKGNPINTDKYLKDTGETHVHEDEPRSELRKVVLVAHKKD